MRLPHSKRRRPLHLITSVVAKELSKQGLLYEPEFPYIATPFSAYGVGAERKMFERYQSAVLISSVLFKLGRPHYAPIVSTYPPSKILKNPADSGFWLKLDEVTLRRCDGLWVIMMPEWASSKGIKREVEFFSKHIADQGFYIGGNCPLPVRFYPLQSFLDGDLHTFQIMKEQQHLLPQLPNT